MKIQERKLVSLPILGKIGITFYDLACDVLELYAKTNEFGRQKKINHLGIISNILEGASHTRYEYLMFQAGLTDLLDKLHKGTATVAQGTLTINRKKHLGNAILKSWFLLSNFGHTKNTYGDEKSLLLFTLKQRGFRTQLLSPIRDDQLRAWCNKTIDSFDYSAFHHILSIRRVYKEMARQFEKQEKLINIYKLLLLDDSKIEMNVDFNKLEQLKRIFSNIRALSIVTIDSHYLYHPISFDLISTVLSVDNIENIYQDVSLLETIKPIYSSLQRNIYLDKKVLANQRNYEINALHYLATVEKTPQSYDAVIQKAFDEGLIDKTPSNLFPFARFSINKDIQPGTDFYTEFRNIQIVKRSCSWAEASLDYDPFTGTRYADFFINTERFDIKLFPLFISRISNIIIGQITHIINKSETSFKLILDEIRNNFLGAGFDEEEVNIILKKSDKTIRNQTIQGFKKDIVPAFKNLLWSILSYFFKKDYYIDIDYPQKNYDVFGYKFPLLSKNILNNNIKAAIVEESEDEDRVHELEHLLYSLKRTFEGFILVCLVRIRVYNLAEPPEKRLATDIDSSIIKVDDDQLVIQFNESKNYKSGREIYAVKDLRKKLIPALNEHTKGLRVTKVKGFGGKLVISCKRDTT